MGSISYHLRRHGEGLRTRIGVGGLLVHLAIIVVFGVLFPWKRGTVFLEPAVITAYACLGVLFAGPAAAQSFGMERPQSVSEALAGIFWAVAYGEMMAAAILLAGFMTVYTTHRYAFAPDLETLASAGLLGLAASFSFAAAAGWFTLRFSAMAARRVMRIAFLVVLILFFLRSGWAPEVAGEMALVCLGIAAVAV